MNGFQSSFDLTGHELVVTPARPLVTGQFMTVVVEYGGFPDQIIVDGRNGWRRTPDGGAVALGQPEVAWWWFPSNDHPLDKATHDISIFVPDGVEAISNGTMPRPPISQAGFTRWSWRSTKPMITYCVFMAVGEYEILSDTTPTGQPVVNAYSVNLGDVAGAARASVERTAEATEFLVEQFGPYPFEAQGGVVPAGGFGFALETQTRPVYSPAFFGRGSNPYVVVHEMAHQWYGDSVSIAGWRDIWLNEGFATYAEWLWSEATSEGTVQELFDFFYALRPPTDPFWQVMPGDPGPANQFNLAVYQRGGMTLHMLRGAVGDESFFQILRTWARTRQFGNGSTPDFVALAEAISGQQLDGLFVTWLYTPGRPPLDAAAQAAASVAPKSFAKVQHSHELLSAARHGHA